ncbi:DNA cytosine methyltransferase [Streptomyces sp. NPDC051130]
MTNKHKLFGQFATYAFLILKEEKDMRVTGRGLFVDAFAGGGGASQGVYEATGHHVDVAINHDESAIVLHQANHPKTHHYLQSVYDVNPLKLVTDEKGNFNNFINALWASPDCRHHSNASGKAINRSEEIRGLAWSVIPYAALPEDVRPGVIFLENVVEFMSWGPLDENGKPIKEKAGVNFHSFIKALNSLGYKVEWKVLVAADYGVATTRERFFLVARCDGKPIC